MSSLPGITRQDEEKRLQHTLEIAQRKVDANRQSVQALAEELHAMQEEFDENDKEAQTLWHNADARFKFVNQDLRRAEQARKKPYFGRIDFRDKKLKKDEVYYIGRSVIADNPAEPEVIDWRAPIASVYYDAALGDVSYSVKGEGKYDITLSRKRTYEIENDELKDFYDSDVVANDELLTKYLARNKKAVLGEIIATIQQEQNEVIRKKPQHNMIVQGAAGSGKTTTLACIVDAINHSRSGHILTLEDPVEYIHRHDKCIVNQREIQCDCPSYVAALRSALRESPDVIFLGEMRDRETMEVAMSAAETGQLLLSTLHTIGAANTIDRIIDAFPPEQQSQIRLQLSMVLQTVISQQLVPDVNGNPIPVFEIMHMNLAIRNLIRESKTHQIDSAIASNASQGMRTMDMALLDLWNRGQISRETALTYCTNLETMRKKLG